jgi:hypothetical protein
MYSILDWFIIIVCEKKVKNLLVFALDILAGHSARCRNRTVRAVAITGRPSAGYAAVTRGSTVKCASVAARTGSKATRSVSGTGI